MWSLVAAREPGGPLMDWTTTRDKLLSIAGIRRPSDTRTSDGSARAGSRGVASNGHALPRVEKLPNGRGPRLHDAPLAAPRAASLCIASGKGGTGKSVVTASLASLFGLSGRTLLLDADLGVGNAHILQNVSPERSLVDVIEGEASVASAITRCGGNVELLGAGSGVPRMSELSPYELHLIASGVAGVETDYRTLLVDAAAGISFQTLHFAASCDVVLVVTTPDLTAMTDAYALFKVLARRQPGFEPFLLVNRAPNERVAEETAERIGRVAMRFLGGMPKLIGWCPEDPEVRRCVNERMPVVLGAPASPFSSAIRTVAVMLDEELSRRHPAGFGRRLVDAAGFQAT